MTRTAGELFIDAPVENVYGYLADFSRHTEWAGHPLTVKQVSAGPLAPGARLESVGHMMGKDFTDQVTVTELAPNQRIVFESDSNGSLFRHDFSLRSEGNGTRLEKGFDPFRPVFPLTVIAPILRLTGISARGVAGDLARIKARMERVS